MLEIDLRQGFSDNMMFKLFKFPGGEIHFVSKVDLNEDILIRTRLNTSDDILALCIVVDTIRKAQKKSDQILEVKIPYFPYQQADRNFGEKECFSLKTITHILRNLDVDQYTIFDPHSDVTPALVGKCEVKNNAEFIRWGVIEQLFGSPSMTYNASMLAAIDKLTWLSPDAGAYKKIFKLAEHISFRGEIVTANKSRSLSTGNIDSLELSKNDFGGKDVLVIDDICVGGRTFVELAKKLKDKNIGKLYLAVSHGIFSNGFDELLEHYSKIFTTDSRADHYYSKTTGLEIASQSLSVYKII